MADATLDVTMDDDDDDDEAGFSQEYSQFSQPAPKARAGAGRRPLAGR